MQEVEFLRCTALFAGLSESDLETVAGLFRKKDYPRNSIIFLESSPGDQFYIVKSGSVRIYRIADDGREMVLDVITAGDFFGEMALLDGYLRSATAQTREPTEVLAMRGETFCALVREKPAIALTIVATLSHRLRKANAQMEDLAFRSARARIIRTLIRLSLSAGTQCQGGIRLSLRLTHQELGALSGTSRVTVTRVLQDLQDKKLIRVDRRYLVIVDLNRLELELN